MKSIRLPIMLCAIVLLMVFLSGCQTIGQIFATETPTPTPTATATETPTPTATATATSTATATPTPPVRITACMGAEDCPDVEMAIWFTPEQAVDINTEYPITIPYTTNLGFKSAWCATERTILDQNMEHIRFVFTIDDVSYLNDLTKAYYEMPYEDDPAQTYPCFGIGGYLSGWQVGEVHSVVIGLLIQDAVSDGWDDYEAGALLLQEYRVIPAELPTETPTPTATNTPLPLPTWTPAPIATATPACGEMGSIEVNNDTGGVVTLYLTGPAKYTFSLGTGMNTLNVCGGSYSYTAYGCGGASDSGTMATGDSQEFFCQ